MSAAALLRDLVRTASLSGQEQAAGNLVQAWLEQAGISVLRSGASVVVEIRGAEAAADAPVILYCSHLDTVPAAAGWTSDPWQVDWKDGVLRGLGANDAKASVAAMCCAAITAAANPQLLGGTVLRLALVSCEETDNSGAAAVLAECGLPDAAVIGEPTNLSVVRSQAGLAILTATWSGTSCHSAHAERDGLDNALLHAASELATLQPCTVFDAAHPLLGPTTLVPAVLHAGDRHNRVPDQAHAIFDVRLTPPHEASMLRDYLAEALPTATVEVRSDRLRAIDTPAEHHFVQAAVTAAGTGPATGSNTMSDMALLVGIPAVKCGPGRTERSHTADEYVTADELQAGVDFYTTLLPLAAQSFALSV